MLEAIANLKWYWMLLIVLALFALRYALRNAKGPVGKQIAEIAESLAIALALVFFIIRPFIVQTFYIPSGSMRITLLENDYLMVNKFLYRFKQPEKGDIIVFKAPPEASPDNKEHDFIKRLIAEPGDTIEVRGGYIEIDGEAYNHNYLRELLEEFVPPDTLGIDEENMYPRVKILKNAVMVNGRKVTAKDIANSLDNPKAKVTFHPGVVILNGKPQNEPYTAEDPDEDFSKRKVPHNHYFMLGDNRNNSKDSRYWGPLERKRIMGKSMFIFWPLNRIRWIK